MKERRFVELCAMCWAGFEKIRQEEEAVAVQLLGHLPKMNLPHRHKEKDRRRDGQGVVVNYVMAAAFGEVDDLVEIVAVGVIRPLCVVPTGISRG